MSPNKAIKTCIPLFCTWNHSKSIEKHRNKRLPTTLQAFMNKYSGKIYRNHKNQKIFWDKIWLVFSNGFLITKFNNDKSKLILDKNKLIPFAWKCKMTKSPNETYVTSKLCSILRSHVLAQFWKNQFICEG